MKNINEPSCEKEILETLEEHENINDFIQISIHILESLIFKAVKYYLNNSQNYEAQFIVEPLFLNNGPFTDNSVQLKLLLGLGKLSYKWYCFCNFMFDLDSTTPLSIDDIQNLFSKITNNSNVKSKVKLNSLENLPTKISLSLSEAKLKSAVSLQLIELNKALFTTKN